MGGPCVGGLLIVAFAPFARQVDDLHRRHLSYGGNIFDFGRLTRQVLLRLPARPTPPATTSPHIEAPRAQITG